MIDQLYAGTLSKLDKTIAERNDALQLARELRDALQISQNSSFLAPETREESDAADRAREVIDEVLAKANKLLK